MPIGDEFIIIKVTGEEADKIDDVFPISYCATCDKFYPADKVQDRPLSYCGDCTHDICDYCYAEE